MWDLSYVTDHRLCGLLAKCGRFPLAIFPLKTPIHEEASHDKIGTILDCCSTDAVSTVRQGLPDFQPEKQPQKIHLGLLEGRQK